MAYSIALLAIVAGGQLNCFGQPSSHLPDAPVPVADFHVTEDATRVEISTRNYNVDILKQGFRYGFSHPDGKVIAEPGRDCGLEFGGGHAATTRLLSSGSGPVRFEVTNDKEQRATVEIRLEAHDVRFTVTQSQPSRILARIGGISPAFGLADHAAFGRTTTDITGFIDDHFRANEPNESIRLISNFVISPARGIALVNMDRGMKIVRVETNEVSQGVAWAASMPALYYFLGSPQEIYSAYVQARNQEGYRVIQPKYEFFGVGWEAFGALGWKTNEKTVTENVDHYLGLGYPLEWMVVGSGFWPNEDPALRATTSFGLWDKTRYPDHKKFIGHFKKLGLKFFLGLRIAFIKDGPFAAEGVANGYFLKENGVAKAWQLSFPHSPAYLLDGANPAAVNWYVKLCKKWLNDGVDGFKEDLYGYRATPMLDGNIDLVNQALMDKGVFIMGRNGYLGSASDVHRINDFNFNQDQDRGPINVLSFAYSGFGYAYPDIVGGTFGEGRKMPPLTSRQLQTYLMRSAQFDALNPSMAVGIGPWNFGSAQVEQVVLAMAKLHARLHPYIYSAAIDNYKTGFPWTLTPLPLLFPEDPNVYGRENNSVRGYEWMLGPSLLAAPLYGNDYATATSRDVYLPAGKWIEFDSGQVHIGPKLISNYPIPVDKTPLFIGGKGILILQDLTNRTIEAVVYPIAINGSTYRFTARDGITITSILNDNTAWEKNPISVTDTTRQIAVPFSREERTGAIRFPIIPGNNYRIADADKPQPDSKRSGAVP